MITCVNRDAVMEALRSKGGFRGGGGTGGRSAPLFQSGSPSLFLQL